MDDDVAAAAEWWDEESDNARDEVPWRSATQWCPRSNVTVMTTHFLADGDDPGYVNLTLTLHEFKDVTMDVAAARELRDAVTHSIELAEGAAVGA